MRIVHYNTFAEGGSPVLMRRFHLALSELGYDRQVRYCKSNLRLSHVLKLEYYRSRLDRQRERVHQRFEAWVLRPDAPLVYGRYRSP